MHPDRQYGQPQQQLYSYPHARPTVIVFPATRRSRVFLNFRYDCIERARSAANQII